MSEALVLIKKNLAEAFAPEEAHTALEAWKSPQGKGIFTLLPL